VAFVEITHLGSKIGQAGDRAPTEPSDVNKGDAGTGDAGKGQRDAPKSGSKTDKSGDTPNAEESKATKGQDEADGKGNPLASPAGVDKQNDAKLNKANPSEPTHPRTADADADTDVAAGQPAAGEQTGQRASYMAYFFPGTIVMILLFTAIFSTFSVIEDRREGFMQAVLVSPSPRVSIVMGKVLGCASIATIQAALFLLAWPFVSGSGVTGGVIARMILGLPVMFVVASGLAAFGLCLAWKIDSTAGFHAIMNLVLFPMWFLCGAVFPVPEAGVMRWLMLINPLIPWAIRSRPPSPEGSPPISPQNRRSS